MAPVGRRGQAAVELVALAPLALGALAGATLVLGRDAAVAACARAAGAAALAQARGDDPRGAARAALPRALARGARIEVAGDRVTVAAAVALGPLRLRADASAPLPRAGGPADDA